MVPMALLLVSAAISCGLIAIAGAFGITRRKLHPGYAPTMFVMALAGFVLSVAAFTVQVFS
jgi:hypothetical protein